MTDLAPGASPTVGRGGPRAGDSPRKHNPIIILERLKQGIKTLIEKGDRISATTIYRETGLAYNTYKRIPKALAYFQAHSTALKTQPTRRASAPPTSDDPLESLPRKQLIRRVRKEMQLRAEAECREAEEREIRQKLEADLRRLREERTKEQLTIVHLQAQLAVLDRLKEEWR